MPMSCEASIIFQSWNFLLGEKLETLVEIIGQRARMFVHHEIFVSWLKKKELLFKEEGAVKS